MRLVLASTSPYRRELLGRLGVPFDAVAHQCDEDAVMTSGMDAETVASTLARAKAESVAGDHEGAWVLGSDQVVAHEGDILGKAGTVERARAQLKRLAGGTHRLITAVAIRHPNGGVDEALSVCTMTMRALSDDEIRRYVDADSPLDCCGAYKVESRGIALFERIECDDFTSITGLPLMRVGQMLRSVGFQVP